jgi:hypothetical protein
MVMISIADIGDIFLPYTEDMTIRDFLPMIAQKQKLR